MAKRKRVQTKIEKKPPPAKVEGTPCHIWVLIMVILMVLLIFVSGWAKVQFDEVEYWGSVPLDVYTGILFFAAALFIPLTVLLKTVLQRPRR
jgi:hypothetical protein